MADTRSADQTGEKDARGNGSIVPTDIDLDFAPRPVDHVAVRELGDELVLFHEAEEIVFVLDRLGAFIWRNLDGELTLRELADDFVSVLGAPAQQVEEDLLTLARKLGARGLLEGMAALSGTQEARGTLAVGDELMPFVAPDMSGAQVDITHLRGRQVLLVNWSPTCGFCLRIAPELAEMAPRLADRGVELVLLSTGSAEENTEVFDEHGLHVRTLLKPYGEDEDDQDEDEHDPGADDRGADDAFADPFPAMGTPVAYLLDAGGRVAAPLAFGSNEVPALTRSLAGIVEEVAEPLPEDVKFLNLADDGTCGPGGGSGKAPRVWASAGAYRIGEYRVGVRPDSAHTDEILTRFLAASRLPAGTRVPDDYSLVLGDGGTTRRGLNLVLQGGSTVIRTRSPRRALMGLAGYLSSHLAAEPTGLLRAMAVGLILDGEAVILPAQVNDWLEDLQPRLARYGARPIDRPYVTIDVERLEVIVDEPALPLDLSVLEELPEPPPRRSELAMVEPGRYPFKRWLIWQSNEDPPLSRADLVARAIASCGGFAGTFDSTLRKLDGLREEGLLSPFDFMTIDELVARLPAAMAGQAHADPARVEATRTS